MLLLLLMLLSGLWGTHWRGLWLLLGRLLHLLLWGLCRGTGREGSLLRRNTRLLLLLVALWIRRISVQLGRATSWRHHALRLLHCISSCWWHRGSGHGWHRRHSHTGWLRRAGHCWWGRSRSPVLRLLTHRGHALLRGHSRLTQRHLCHLLRQLLGEGNKCQCSK